MVDVNSEILYTVEYSAYPNKSMGTPHHRRCINGKTTGCGNCVGYCKYNGHPGYLTRELRKQHDCVKKGCNYYIPKCPPPVTVSPFAVLTALF